MDEELKKLLAEAYDTWGRDTVKAIIKKIDEYPIRYQGTLRRSISYQTGKVGGGDEVSFNMADYGKFIDEGVNGTLRSRNSPYSFKGKWKGTALAITPWARAKGLNPYAVAYRIQERGIKPRPFFNSVIEARFPELERLISQAAQKALDNQIDNFNKQP